MTTPDYGYITNSDKTNSEISQCEVTITNTVPSDTYETGSGPGHRTAKDDANEVERTYPPQMEDKYTHTT